MNIINVILKTYYVDLNSICCPFLFHNNNKKGGKLRMHGGGFACGGSMSGHQSLLSRSLLHLDKRFKVQYIN